MSMIIKSAAVIGAGTMGSGIAAHLANCGIPTLLLDIVPRSVPDGVDDSSDAFRTSIAAGAVERMIKARPAPLYDRADIALITPGNLEDHFDLLAGVDWIVEAVPERIEIKRPLFERLASIHKEGQLVTSNTSGISINAMVEGLPDSFRRCTFITHFFNPPRYMHLLELVQCQATDPQVFTAFSRFATRTLGKGVVVCKDTPNFIANRIGAFDMANALRLALQSGLSVQDVDAIAGPLIGRPKTGVFRLIDMVGTDIASHVIRNVYAQLPNDEMRTVFEPSPVLEKMVESKLLGQKTGSGFYRKSKDDAGKRVIEALDLKTFDYGSATPASFESITSAKSAATFSDKLKTLLSGSDAAADFAWSLVSGTLCYAANRIPEISDDIEAVDRAMRWGYNWTVGPFELWDAIGIRSIVERLQSANSPVPPLVTELLNNGVESFYSSSPEGQATVYDRAAGRHIVAVPLPESIHLAALHEAGNVVRSGKMASLLDLGKGVLCVEFHSKANSLSGEVLELISDAVSEAEDNFEALVIGNQGRNFCLGADLSEMAAAASSSDFEEIGRMIDRFHHTMRRVRFSRIPVVTAAHGMVLGGACELAMHSDRIQAAPETYIGLVEVGVGLIPAGGGSKEWALRCSRWANGEKGIDIFPEVNRVLMMVGKAETSSSATHARSKGYLRHGDIITMNPDSLIHSARETACGLAASGYRPPLPETAIRVLGRGGIAEFKVRLNIMRQGGFITAHDETVVNRFAHVLCGGERPDNSLVSEDDLLELEREAFLSVLGEPKTQERIAHTLKTGKPLRN